MLREKSSEAYSNMTHRVELSKGVFKITNINMLEVVMEMWAICKINRQFLQKENYKK